MKNVCSLCQRKNESNEKFCKGCGKELRKAGAEDSLEKRMGGGFEKNSGGGAVVAASFIFFFPLGLFMLWLKKVLKIKASWF